MSGTQLFSLQGPTKFGVIEGCPDLVSAVSVNNADVIGSDPPGSIDDVRE